MNLKNELGKEILQEITDEILKLESLAYHDFGSYSWPDDVMKRFIKISSVDKRATLIKTLQLCRWSKKTKSNWNS